MSEPVCHRQVLLDTGPLVALVDVKEAHHARCVEILRVIEPPLLTSWPVITEAAWLLRHHQHAWQTLVEGIHRGLFALLPLEANELSAINALMKQYRILSLQLADAVLIHLADREGLTTVFTLDQRDFSVIRLRNKQRLLLLPTDDQ